MKKKYKNKKPKAQLLPFDVIVSATKGDAEALDMVIKHYQPYISTLCTKPVRDEYGNSYMYVDDNMRRRLEIKLITKILAFEIL